MDPHQRRRCLDIAQHQRHGLFLAAVSGRTRIEMAFKAHNAEVSPARGEISFSHLAESEIGTHTSIIEGGWFWFRCQGRDHE